MKIAVVVINFNGEKLLSKFLPTLIKNTSNADIYIIDNNSDDNSIDYIKSNFPKVKCIILDQNYGFAGGYNRGLNRVNADIFCLLNNDVEVTKNWIKPIYEVFDTNKNISIAQPKILNFKNKKLFEYSGAAGGFIDSLGYPYCKGRIFDSIEKDDGQYDFNKEIFWASGACFFIRKNVWNGLKGFDEDFFAHFEEIDLCWRAFNKDFKAILIGKSKVYHLGGGTLPVSGYKWYLNFKNSLILLTKNLPKKDLFKILSIRLVLDIVACVRFILMLQITPFFSVIRANYIFYTNFKYHYKKRKSINYKTNYWSTKSIIWNYFIKKEKKFTTISK